MIRSFQLECMTEVQCSDGYWNFNPHMHGTVDGTILAHAAIKSEVPIYLDALAGWEFDRTEAVQETKQTT